MAESVLLLGADEGVRSALLTLLPRAQVRTARAAVDTEGIGVDVVVVAGEHPLEELTEVRVHPRLYAQPVVLLAPGHRLPGPDWHAVNVWPITNRGPRALNDLVERVEMLLSCASHPCQSSPAIERRPVRVA